MSADQKNPSLRVLIAAPVPLQVGTLTLHVAPMGWTQGSIAIEHLLPAMRSMPTLIDANATQRDRIVEWASLAIVFRDEIAAFCAEASGLPIDDIKALPPTAIVELVVGLVEINLDFFVQSLPGLAQRAHGRLAGLTEKLAAAAASTTSSSAS